MTLAERFAAIDKLSQAESGLAKTLALLAALKSGEIPLERLQLIEGGFTILPERKPEETGPITAKEVLESPEVGASSEGE